MKRLWIVNFILIIVLGIALVGHAKPRIYKWVKDKKVSAHDVLRRSQYSRVVPMSETKVQEVIQSIMTDDLYLALAQYHKTRHQQDAETTADSVLPEEVVHQKEIELIDEDYRFILEVKTKRYGNRTRVMVNAAPVYRIRDFEAEAARDGDDSTGGSSIEVKVKTDRSSAMALGPILVAPILGLPCDYGITPLPDAAERAGEIVKSFMYFLDMRMKAGKKSKVKNTAQSAVAEKGSTVQNKPQPTITSTVGTEPAVEVEISGKFAR